MKHLAGKTLAIFLSVTLSATAVRAKDAKSSQYPPRTQYMAVMMDGKKVGHSVATFKIDKGKAVTNVKMTMTLSRGGMAITIAVDTVETETPDGKPVGFALTINQGPLGQIVTRGTIGGDGKLHVVMNVAGMTQNKTIPWPQGALMSHGRMIIERKAGMKPGTTVTSTVFDPTALAARTVTSTVGEKTKVDLLGRVVMLTEVKSVMQSKMGKINATSYIDDEFIPLKSIVPALGMKIEMIDCSKAVAMASNETLDLISKVILSSPVALTKEALAGPLVYTIKPTSPEATPEFLDGANQSVKTADDKTTTLTIRPTPAPKNAPLQYKGKDPTALEALKPSGYVQSDHKTIKDLARKAIGDAKDAATAVAKIEAFVRKYIKTKNLSVGYATAVEVAQSREGDCTEHAVLTASLCRAVGIPAQVVMGLAYVNGFAEHRNVFGPHAWNRAFVGGKWVGLDSALKEFNTGHIALACGDGISDDMLKVVNTIGNFKIITIKTPKDNK
ncbi:MAG: transglutaminase domain-containing protein [Phycisphaerae bacterium]|nr:transglutaminase domain-containing protein [Phycisphaerae bacterium]